MVRKKITEAYEAAQEQGRQQVYRRPYLLPIAGLLVGAAIVFGVVASRHGESLHVSDSHVIFLFDKGQRRTIDTKSKTVGELLKKLPLQLAKHDVVEPSAKSKIVEDNFRINIYRARPVTVVDRGTKKVTLTAQQSARVVAEQAGLKIAPEDEATFEPGSIKNNTLGEQVVILRSIGFHLNLYGKPLDTHTHAKTVGTMLDEKGVHLSKGDSVKPSLDSKIKDGMQVFVLRKGAKIVTREEKIKPPTQYVSDPSLSLGATAVRQKGSAGRKAVTYLLTVQKGKPTKRQIIQTVIVEDPVPKIIARGNIVNVGGNKERLMSQAGIKSSDYGYVNFIVSHESNWNPAARNAGGCLGLGQACPGGKLTNICSLNDPVCQLKYFSGYANGRYGGWGGAYNFWTSHNYW